MDKLQLEYFLAVARAGNMTAAAAELNVAQSSVSRSIARLEGELGVPLFDRGGRRIVLNDFGKIFYAKAEASIRELNEGERQLKELRDQYTGRVSISTSSAHQLDPLMSQYVEEHPDVLFRQRQLTDMSAIQSCLDSGALDYSLTYGPLPGPEYEWLPVFTERYYFLMSANHPLADRKSLSLKDVQGERFLINSCDDPTFIEDQFIRGGCRPTFSFITDEYESLGPMVEHGAGTSIISTLGIYGMRKNLSFRHLSQIRTIPVKEEAFRRELGILYRRHHYLSPAAKNFYKQMLTYFKTVRQEVEALEER